MAINTTVYGKGESKWGFAEQITFGTAEADSTNYTMLEGPIPTGINYGVNRHHMVKHGGGRVQEEEQYNATQNGQLIEIPFSDLIVREDTLADLIYAVMQSLGSEGAGSPYVKIFEWDEDVTQPAFGSSAGYFATIFIEDPIASYHRKFHSCILRDLTLTADFAGDGRLMASGTWVTGFPHSDTANFSGTPVYNTQEYFYMNKPTTKQINGSDVVVYGLSLTFNNGAVRHGMDSSAQCEGYTLANTDDGYLLSGEIMTKYDANTQGLIADSVAGTCRKIEYNIGDVGAAGHLQLEMNKCALEDIEHSYDDERGQALTIPFIAKNDTSGSLPLAQIIVTDNNDRGW